MAMTEGSGSTLAEALAAVVLEQFEGKDVRRAGVEIPNVAGGLRKAMKIQPRTMKQGERGMIAFEYIVQKVRFEPIDKDAPGGDQERIHVLMAEGATFVDAEVVAEAIKAQKELIAKAEEEAKGIQRLDIDGSGSPQDSAQAGDKPKRGRGRRGPISAVPDAPGDETEPGDHSQYQDDEGEENGDGGSDT